MIKPIFLLSHVHQIHAIKSPYEIFTAVLNDVVIFNFFVFFFYNILCSLAFPEESSNLSQGGPTLISARWQGVMSSHWLKKDSPNYFPLHQVMSMMFSGNVFIKKTHPSATNIYYHAQDRRCLWHLGDAFICLCGTANPRNSRKMELISFISPLIISYFPCVESLSH